jgi:lipopolysaccharide transport system ATP-binding protein
MIRVTGISKTYVLWRAPASRILLPLARRFLRPFSAGYYQALAARHCQEVQALTDINFLLEGGSSLGIIGLNGSGKSTLLQIIAGTLQPTSGQVEVKGRVAALLELGSGFDPEFTGRENIFLNAAILGLTRKEIDDRYQAIVDFADIGEFIDRPVKTYSSGMMVRLAFAVQVHVDPDVLIVDEALAVGDARFQAKALNKIEEILKRGTTLLFVGHDLSAVRSFCNRALLLERGRVVSEGLPDDVIADYLLLVQKDRAVLPVEKKQSKSQNLKGQQLKAKARDFALSTFDILQAEIRDHGEHATLAFGKDIWVDIDLRLSEAIPSPALILDIIDSRGMQLTGRRISVPDGIGEKKVGIKINCSLQKGIYRIRLRLVSAPSLEQTQLMSRYSDLLSFEMIEDVRAKFTGLFPVPMECVWQDDV